MQWKHQARPPGLSYGMVIAFTEEALRTVQDPIPLHEVIFSEYATASTLRGPRSACPGPHCEEPRDLVEILLGDCRVASVFAICH